MQELQFGIGFGVKNTIGIGFGKKRKFCIGFGAKNTNLLVFFFRFLRKNDDLA